MINLPLFMRSAREAQGIAQWEISEKTKDRDGKSLITQSAIAQFEKMKISIATEKLMKIAPILNINPEFIKTGEGNPFKQADKNQIIKMLIQEDPFRKVDYGLLKTIAESNMRASFYFLRPTEFHEEELKKKDRLRSWNAVFAIGVIDEDKNMFLFKRKEKNRLFDMSELKTMVPIASQDKRFFKIYNVGLPLEMYDSIKKWGDIDVVQLHQLFSSVEAKDHKDVLFDMIHVIWAHRSMANDQKAYKKILQKIKKMNAEEAESFVDKLMPGVASNIKKELQSKK